MPSPFWGALAGVALFALALIWTLAFGWSLGRTRTNLAGLQRLLHATRRLNDDVVAAASKELPSIDIVKAPEHSK